jgi:hypothetical protein
MTELKVGADTDIEDFWESVPSQCSRTGGNRRWMQSCVLSGGGTELSCLGASVSSQDTPTGFFVSFFAKAGASTGQHEWDLFAKFTEMNNATFGVSPVDNDVHKHGLGWCNGDQSRRGRGWAIDIGDGQVSHTLGGDGAAPYASALQRGPGSLALTVRLTFNGSAGTLEFVHQDRSLGVAFNDVQGPVRLAGALGHNTKGTITILAHRAR